MPNPTWPATLQTAPGADAQRTRNPNVIRTPMDVGPAKMRRRSSNSPINLSFSMLVTTAQRAELETFYVTTLKEVLPFDWNDFFVTGYPVATFRFLVAPDYENVSGELWRTQIKLEQLT